MNSFNVGELYFMIWYPDLTQKYLVPDSIVFLGKNLEGDRDAKDAWYFQDTDSFCTRGPALGTDSSNAAQSQTETHVYRLLQEDLSQVVDADGLAAELARCTELRRS